ncbi:hypothetical protein J6590_011480 [Homalodisca vitripennis]|nr:hypothetical protein J6590_011480 [Homalodisca vitripennis]
MGAGTPDKDFRTGNRPRAALAAPVVISPSSRINSNVKSHLGCVLVQHLLTKDGSSWYHLDAPLDDCVHIESHEISMTCSTSPMTLSSAPRCLLEQFCDLGVSDVEIVLNPSFDDFFGSTQTNTAPDSRSQMSDAALSGRRNGAKLIIGIESNLPTICYKAGKQRGLGVKKIPYENRGSGIFPRKIEDNRAISNKSPNSREVFYYLATPLIKGCKKAVVGQAERVARVGGGVRGGGEAHHGQLQRTVTW